MMLEVRTCEDAAFALEHDRDATDLDTVLGDDLSLSGVPHVNVQGGGVRTVPQSALKRGH